ESLPGQLLHLLFEFALAAAHDGRHHLDFFLRLEGKHVTEDLFGRLARDLIAADGAVRYPNGGIEETQIVVNFGDGADGAAGAASGSFLVDGNRRTEAFDGVDVRPLHLIEKLARVGGECFDVAALSFGIDGVESERGLAGAAEAGDDRQTISGDSDINIAKIMLPGARNRDFAQP